MTLPRLSGGAVLALALTCLCTTSEAPASNKSAPDPVRIGMVQSLFADVPQPMLGLLVGPFSKMMKEFTGMNGQLVPGGEVLDVARKLHEDQLELAVFHGFEYGWVQQKYPDLKPLMIAINKHRYFKAHVIVRKDCPLNDFADLKGKDVALPRRTKNHVRMFLDRECSGCAQCDPKSFFSQITSPDSMESALDDVCYGNAFCTLVETLAWKSYEQIKPGCAANLKVLDESPYFPPGVIAYHEGALDEATLARFKEGLITANQSVRGREMMTMWKITAFEPVPDDYQQVVTEIIKAYPPPEAATSPPMPGSAATQM